VKVVREGSEDAHLFFHLLLDEPEQPGSPMAVHPAGAPAAQSGECRCRVGQASAVQRGGRGVM